MANFDRLLKRLVAPGADGGAVRQKLSHGQEVNLKYNNDRQLRIVVKCGKACLLEGQSTLASVAFVAWDELDELYAKKLSEDTLLHDENFLSRYFDRFQTG